MLFSPPFYRVEIKRQLRNPYTLAFTLVMPVAMYLLFGANTEYSADRLGHGNYAFYVMVSMAAFGTATAMVSLCSLAASEVGQGWGRQIAMTPLSMPGYALVKVATAVTFAALSSAAVVLTGALTGAQADDLWRWIAAVGIVLGAGMIYGLFGLGVGLAMNSDSAAALASISITFFAFLGNVFMPLSGVMLTIAHYTPLYGYVALARWPLTGGELASGGADSLWLLVLNLAAWTVAFVVLTRIGVLRSRRRG